MVGEDAANGSVRRPNLFNFATSELSQDAFLSWLLSWADAKCAPINPTLHNVGTDFLNSIFLKKGVRPPVKPRIVIKQQEANIDILCIVNDDTAIIIEDKVGTEQHSGQLARYKEYVRTQYPTYKIIPVYLQTGDQSDYSAVEKAEYAIVRRHDVLGILGSERGKAAAEVSDIFSDFTSYLRKIEDDVQSYATTPLANWSWNAWKGFYARLQQGLKDKYQQPSNWHYVPNASGGFMGFHWHWRSDQACEQFLQLEETKLCFKISVKEPSQRRQLRYEWYERILRSAGESGVSVKKPSRFGNGQWMTVAVHDGEYRSADQEGKLDIDGTVKTLRKCEQLLNNAVSDTGTAG